MPEPREDMVADFAPQPELETHPIPEPEVQEIAPEQEETPQENQPAPQVKGDKTPKNLLYESLVKERNKRKELELQIEQLRLTPSDLDEVLSDEGKYFKAQLDAVNNRINNLLSKQETDQVFNKYPQILDKLDEFDEFKQEYPDVPLDKVARLFVSEKGLASDTIRRKGLERGTSGPKEKEPDKIKASDIDRLMKGDEKKFAKLIRSGAFDGDNIIDG